MVVCWGFIFCILECLLIHCLWRAEKNYMFSIYRLFCVWSIYTVTSTMNNDYSNSCVSIQQLLRKNLELFVPCHGSVILNCIVTSGPLIVNVPIFKVRIDRNGGIFSLLRRCVCWTEKQWRTHFALLEWNWAKQVCAFLLLAQIDTKKIKIRLFDQPQDYVPNWRRQTVQKFWLSVYFLEALFNQQVEFEKIENLSFIIKNWAKIWNSSII